MDTKNKKPKPHTTGTSPQPGELWEVKKATGARAKKPLTTQELIRLLSTSKLKPQDQYRPAHASGAPWEPLSSFSKKHYSLFLDDLLDEKTKVSPQDLSLLSAHRAAPVGSSAPPRQDLASPSAKPAPPTPKPTPTAEPASATHRATPIDSDTPPKQEPPAPDAKPAPPAPTARPTPPAQKDKATHTATNATHHTGTPSQSTPHSTPKQKTHSQFSIPPDSQSAATTPSSFTKPATTKLRLDQHASDAPPSQSTTSPAPHLAPPSTPTATPSASTAQSNATKASSLPKDEISLESEELSNPFKDTTKPHPEQEAREEEHATQMASLEDFASIASSFKQHPKKNTSPTLAPKTNSHHAANTTASKNTPPQDEVSTHVSIGAENEDEHDESEADENATQIVTAEEMARLMQSGAKNTLLPENNPPNQHPGQQEPQNPQTEHTHTRPGFQKPQPQPSKAHGPKVHSHKTNSTQSSLNSVAPPSKNKSANTSANKTISFIAGKTHSTSTSQSTHARPKTRPKTQPETRQTTPPLRPRVSAAALSFLLKKTKSLLPRHKNTSKTIRPKNKKTEPKKPILKKTNRQTTTRKTTRQTIKLINHKKPRAPKPNNAVLFLLIAVAAPLVWMAFNSSKPITKRGPSQAPQQQAPQNAIKHEPALVRFVPPNFDMHYAAKSFSKKEAQEKLAQAQALYRAGGYVSYQKAQQILGPIAFGNSAQSSAAAVQMCLVRFELKKFAIKKTEPGKIFAPLVSAAWGKTDNVKNAQICHVLNLWDKKQILKATQFLGSMLDKPNIAPQRKSVLLYIKAHFLWKQGLLQKALSYAEQAHQITPNWFGARFFSAKLMAEKQNYKNAHTELGKLLLKYPQNGQLKTFVQILKQSLSIEKIEQTLKTSALERITRAYLHHVLSEKLRPKNPSASIVHAESAFDLLPHNPIYYEKAKALSNALKPQPHSHYLLLKALKEPPLYKKSWRFFVQSIKTNPNNLAAALLYAQSLWRAGFHIESIKALKSLSSPDAYVHNIKYLAHSFDFKNAQIALNGFKARFPKSPKLPYAKAWVYLKSLELNKAVMSAKEAINLYPVEEDFYILLARILIKQKNKESLTYAQKAIDINPLNIEAHLAFSNALFLSSKKRALDYLDQLEKKSPSAPEVKLLKARLLLKAKQVRKSQDLLKKALRAHARHPLVYDIRILRAKVAQKSQSLSLAKKSLTLAIKMRPTRWEAFFELGQVHLLSRAFTKAFGSFKKVQTINPLHPLIYYYMGRAELGRGNTQEALKLADKEQEKNPKRPEPYELKAQAYMQSENWTKCIWQSQKLLDFYPKKDHISLRLAICLQEDGNEREALNIIEGIIAKSPQKPLAYKYRGQYMERAGRKSEAYQAYYKYLSLFPNAPDKKQVRSRMNKL